MVKPFIVGSGSTFCHGPSSQQALAAVSAAAGRRVARSRLFAGQDITLPPYNLKTIGCTRAGKALIDGLRQADGVVISSPCYHRGISGLIENAIDYTEYMRGWPVPTGVRINSQVVKLEAGQCSGTGIAAQLDIMAA